MKNVQKTIISYFANTRGIFLTRPEKVTFMQIKLEIYEDGKPASLIFLDWQISRYSSPVTDLTYSIFCCTDKSLRNSHYERLISYYHKSLADHVQELGSDAEKLFPFEELQKQLKIFSKYSLGITIYDLPNMIANADDMKDLDEMAETLDNEELNMDSFNSLTKQTEPIYKERMRDVILDCLKYEYI